MLRELRKEHRDPLEKFTAMVAVLAIFLVAAFALMEARYGVAESRYVPVAAAQPQPPSNEKRPTPSPVRFLGSPASSAVH